MWIIYYKNITSIYLLHTISHGDLPVELLEFLESACHEFAKSTSE